MAGGRKRIEIVPAEASSLASEPPTPVAGRRLTRRDVLAGAIGAVAAGGGVWGFGRWGDSDTTRSGAITNLADARTTLDAGPVDVILADTTAGRPWYVPDDGEPRVAVVSFDPADQALAQAYLQGVGESDYAIKDNFALVALILRDPHLGCRNVFCESSQWWENPCHGDHYNRIGEKQAGPSPRGLDRYPTAVVDDHLWITLARVIVGPPPGAGVDNQPPAGPHCVG